MYRHSKQDDDMKKIKFKKDTFMTVISQLIEIAKGLKDNIEYTIEIKEYRKKRSKNQNDYCWELCTQIAQVLQMSNVRIDGRMVTKEDIYKDFIKRAGVCEYIAIPEKSVKDFSTRWSSNGVGWFCEVMDYCKVDGAKKVCCYYGSSTYNTEEMTRLLNAIIADCEMYGIEPDITVRELLNSA